MNSHYFKKASEIQNEVKGIISPVQLLFIGSKFKDLAKIGQFKNSVLTFFVNPTYDANQGKKMHQINIKKFTIFCKRLRGHPYTTWTRFWAAGTF